MVQVGFIDAAAHLPAIGKITGRMIDSSGPSFGELREIQDKKNRSMVGRPPMLRSLFERICSDQGIRNPMPTCTDSGFFKMS
jgi:hypothetical protein